MAEVTLNSTTATQCSPPTKKARMEENTDPFKCAGSLVFRIDNFREFSKHPPDEEASKRHCDAKVSVRGLTFGLAVFPVRGVSQKDPTQETLGLGTILMCENTSGYDEKGDGSWSCLASVTLRVKRLLKLRADLVNKFTHRFFSSKEKSSLEWDNVRPWNFNLLFDPKRNVYNEKEDTLELIVEISVDAPVGVMELPKTDIIQVNDEVVFINKNQLAMYSRYFHTMLYNEQYDEGQSGQYKVQIEAPATMNHFNRMLATMYPENRSLDDECLEGVLHLANQFLVTVVEGKCLEFLMEKSNKPALFKYRMADKYGFTALKDHVLLNLNVADFKDEMFMANTAEYAQLGSSATKELKTRFYELFPPKT